MHDMPEKTEIFFSVIIPALNEAETIDTCLSNIRSMGSNVEIIVVDGGSCDIVVDGGSCDATALIAEKSGVKVLHTYPCRGHQCNSGAAIASGKVLIFLHADTILPVGDI